MSVISLPVRARVWAACSTGFSVRARVSALVSVVPSVVCWTVSVISLPVRVPVWAVRSMRVSARARVSKAPSARAWKARSTRAPASAARWKARSDRSPTRARTCRRTSAVL
ncbi:hypothetical protein [Nocardia amikacinitolerans]|uniref:hypothetical protein n=1 Tax=Nocardia amikacinitolerans TaxID=756689 RepID=UPI0020A37E1C|nr:hypothetical protein [Nocardia amikacinitolerans]